MSDSAENSTESGRRPTLTALGVLHVVVTVIGSCAIARGLTPPDRPVDNGLEVLAPGVIILLLGVPFLWVGIILIRQGMKGIRPALLVDVMATTLIAAILVPNPNLWLALVAVPFVADAAVLLTLGRKLRRQDANQRERRESQPDLPFEVPKVLRTRPR